MKKILHWLDENLEEFILVIFLIAMTLIMGIQIFCRYVLGMSLSWSEELTRYLFIWCGFLSVSYCSKKCLSIKIEQFVAIFPRRGKAIFKVVNHTFELIFFIYMIPFAYSYMMSSVHSGQLSPACGIPMYYVQAAPLVSFVLVSLGRRNFTSTNCRIITSSGCPFFSYMASKNIGSMASTMHNAAVVVPTLSFTKKNSGSPIATAALKQISCRFVRLNITLLLIFVKSFGTVTYAISNLLSARNVIFKTGDSIEKPFVIYPPLQMAGNRRGGWTLVNHHIRVKAHSPQGVHAV